MSQTYPTFDDIEHEPLKIYNRTVMFYNILSDAGKTPAEEYASQFSVEDRSKMVATITLVKKIGVKRVQEIVTKGVFFPENPTEEEVVNGTTH